MLAFVRRVTMLLVTVIMTVTMTVTMFVAVFVTVCMIVSTGTTTTSGASCAMVCLTFDIFRNENTHDTTTMRLSKGQHFRLVQKEKYDDRKYER